MGNKNAIANIIWNTSISFLDYTNLFSLNDYEKNDKIILKYF